MSSRFFFIIFSIIFLHTITYEVIAKKQKNVDSIDFNFEEPTDIIKITGIISKALSKNIIYSKNNLFLIDFEPSLLQVKDQTKQWMSTRPYRHHEDIQNNNITAKSDFLGFACFIRWFLSNSNCPQHYVEECSKIITKLKFQSSPFQNLTKLFVN